MPYDFGDLAQPVSAAGATAGKYDFGDLAEPVAAASQKRKTPMELRQEQPGPSGMDVAAARAASFGRGLTDPVTGGAQLLTHMLPKGAVDAGNRLNNWLAKYGLTGEIPAGGFDQKIRDDEADLAQRRKSAGLEGTDWTRVAGNVASPVNYVLPAAAPKGLGFAGRAAVTAGQGGVAGSLSPVTEPTASEGDFWRAKGKQAAAGAATGVGTTAVSSGVARVISPNVRPEVRKMIDAGVSLTPGQMLGGWARSIEEKASSLPLFGEIVHSAERRGVADFNKAVVNKALAPIGEKLPANMAAGHEAIEYAADKIGAKYDALLPKLTGRVDREFMTEVAGIRRLAQNMPKDRAEQLDHILEKEVLGRFGPRGGATGETLKDIESKLGGMASGMRRSSDYDQRSMGDALATVQQSLRDMLKRANPKHAKELRDINSAYSQFLRPQTAAARTGAEDGIFSPAQLRSAVRELDPSKRKAAFAKGKAPGQEFAEAAKAVLPAKVPDSGTAGRLAIANLPSAGAGIAAALGGGAFYTPLGQKAAQVALTARPQGANALANFVRENDRLIGAGTIPLSMLPMFSRGE